MRLGRLIRDTLVLGLTAAYAIPFFWQLLTSFKLDVEILRLPPVWPAGMTLAHYGAVLQKSIIPRALFNSLGIATVTVLLALPLGLLASYALARLPIPGRRSLMLGIVASTAFPRSRP